MKNIKLIILFLGALIAVFLGVWVVQDNSLVTGITLLGFPLTELPIGLWVLVFLVAGIAIGVGLCYLTIFSLKRKLRKSSKQLQKLEAELRDAQDQSVGK